MKIGKEVPKEEMFLHPAIVALFARQEDAFYCNVCDGLRLNKHDCHCIICGESPQKCQCGYCDENDIRTWNYYQLGKQ